MITAGAAAVAVPLGTAAEATAATSPGDRPAAARPELLPSADIAFGTLKRLDAGELEIAYVEAGPPNGPVAVLLHGFPYDVRSFSAVTPLLADAGYRVIVPYLRGHGPTRFRSDRTFRNAQQAVIALDIVALLDALRIRRAVLAGFDWGSRTADIIAALWPERCTALVSVSGYLVTNRAANASPLPPAAELAWWYQYYFATERGELGLTEYTHDFAKLIWTNVSPTWHFDDATFERTAASFTNPDWVPVVIHNYRWRLGLAAGDPRYDRLEKRLADRPKIARPTIALDAAADPFTTAPGDGSAYRDRFTGPYAHRRLAGIGHNVPQEAPAAFAQAVLDVTAL
ncbi:alpha/beta fold hydrolase [Streptomyces polygonati]|uniref:Alpha/beta fold hydrolase n=1 Tax=Streptomyces polygonati TaxID=1617087 RepID=A0ABV8HQZ6_9ACTN